jgi:hypothetical protein
MSIPIEARTLVAPGELRTDALELFEQEALIDFLLAAPGLLPRPPQGHARLAREPHLDFPVQVSHAHRQAILESLGGQLDALPQTPAWEARLGGWSQRLKSTDARVFYHARGPLFSRLISRADSSLVPAGPITREFLGRPPGTELDMALAGGMHAQARAWFQQRLVDAEDISLEVRALLEATWAGPLIGAKDLYYKVLSEFFLEMLQGADLTDNNPLLERMTAFQQAAYQQAKGILRRFGGVFLADVVGLGKTYIAMALLRYLQDVLDRHALVVAPPAVCPVWDALGEEAGVHLRTLSHGNLEALPQFSARQVLVLDESHNFRNPTTRRYERLWEWLHPGGVPSRRQVLLLSATPQNNSPWDVQRQLRLFPDDFTRLPFTGESMEDFFKAVEAGKESLTSILQHVVVRRTRRFIQAQYPNAKLPVKRRSGGYDWVPIRFPIRISGPEQCLRYQIEDSYGAGLYDRIIHLLSSMEYPLYGLGAYVLEMHKKDERLAGIHQAGRSLRGLFKVLLLKRLESSEAAFRISLVRLQDRLRIALENLREGFIVLHMDVADEEDGESESLPAGMFHIDRLRNALQGDLARVEELCAAMGKLPPAAEAKLARLRAYLETRPPRVHRTLIFTQFADTADFLMEHLREGYGVVERVTGSKGSVRQLVRRFAPRANPTLDGTQVPREKQIDLLISTDALSEGINLQDADTLINYDLHWNPVRLIQRAGRIDRLGSENEEIHIASFLPERGLESQLGLEQVLRRRIKEFLDVFGEDSHVLPAEERLDVQGALDAYAGKAFEKAEMADDLDALGRHAERILTLRQTEPAHYMRIKALRSGRRAATDSALPGIVATRLGWYWGFWRESKENGRMEKLADLAGLDLLYKHSEKGDASAPEKISQARRVLSLMVEESRQLFSQQAENVRAQRQTPALDINEEWVRASLEALRMSADEERRGVLDDMRRWVLAGQYKTVLRLAAARWRKEQLTGEALFQQMAAMMRFELKNEFLGEEEIVGAVTGTGVAT